MAEEENLIGPQGGYRNLYAFQLSEIIYDGTVICCRRAFPARSRMIDQMIQAARSGRQNIAEGSQVSGTSKEAELKLTNVARASLEELLLDYQDFLRQNELSEWAKDEPKAVYIRKIASRKGRSFETNRPYLAEKSLESAANTLICLIHQTNYLLDRLLLKQGEEFLAKGGFREKLSRARRTANSSMSFCPPSNKSNSSNMSKSD